MTVKVGRLSADYMHDVSDTDNRDYSNNRRIVESPPEAIQRFFARLSKPIINSSGQSRAIIERFRVRSLHDYVKTIVIMIRTTLAVTIIEYDYLTGMDITKSTICLLPTICRCLGCPGRSSESARYYVFVSNLNGTNIPK